MPFSFFLHYNMFMAEQRPGATGPQDEDEILYGRGVPDELAQNHLGVRNEVRAAVATAALTDSTERATTEGELLDIREAADIHFVPAGDIKAQNGARPERNAQMNGQYQNLARRLLRQGLYNVAYDGNGNAIGHLDLKGAPEIDDLIRQRIAELAAQGKIRVITPFVNELQARLNVGYNARLVGAENIVAVEAGVEKPDQQQKRFRAIAQVQQEGAPVINQKDIISEIPWRVMKEAGIFRKPEQFPDEPDGVFAQRYEQEMDQPPEGSKGLTMFAAVVLLYSRDKFAREQQAKGGIAGTDYDPHNILSDDTIIMFHDTDIGNPDTYDATKHAVGFPITFPPEGQPFITGQIARLGRGRNNEPIAGEVNRMANLGATPLERQLGTALQSVIWHLTGERWISWGELKRMPFAPRMGIESLINFYMASRTIEEGYEVRAQVPVVERKREYDPVTGSDEESYPDREFDMVYMLQIFYAALGRYTSETGKLPSQWDVADISRFNETFGGMFVFNTVNGPLSDEPNERKVVSTKEQKVKRLDPLIPSCKQLDAMGLLPTDTIQAVTPHPQITF